MKQVSLILVLWLLALRVWATDFLPVEQAFRLQVTRDAQGGPLVQWDIAPGYKLYRRSLHVDVAGGDARLAPLSLPQGQVVHDDNFSEDVEIYHGLLRVPLVLSPVGAGAVLTVQYQGCAEAGLCYPPQTQRVTLATAAVGMAPAALSATAPATESGRLQRLLQAGPTLQLILAFVAFGLLLAFTPCVLPMLPILASLIVGNGTPPGRRRAFALSLAYSLGMALVYTLFGVAAGLAGEGLAGALQQPPVLIGFALLLTLLALSQFDLYTLQLPGGLMERVTNASNRLRGGQLVPVFLMGGLSALMVGPCVAAPLAGALLYISQTHNVVTGGVALFSLASGMSLPLLALGLSAGTVLPRAGAWMNGVKQFFGQLLLGVALWMVSPLLPANVLLGLWGAWAVLGAIFLRVLERSEAGASASRRFGQWAGVVLLLAGIFELAGAAVGSEDPLHPLEGFRSRETTFAQTPPPSPRFRRIHSLQELHALIRGSSKPVLLDFYADWCVSCKEMERLTFADPAVTRVMQGYTLVQADVTANSEAERDLLKTFQLFGPPGILVFSAQGQELPDRRVIGFMKPAEFLTHLQPS